MRQVEEVVEYKMQVPLKPEVQVAEGPRDNRVQRELAAREILVEVAMAQVPVFMPAAAAAAQGQLVQMVQFHLEEMAGMAFS
jgi:hypothetical protein